ncbi:MAG: DUF1080 domain-containing protein [Reichenbachiella sp.]
MKRFLLIATCCFSTLFSYAQKDPKTTELWEPVPSKVTAGENRSAPSDAIVLFDGKDLSMFQSKDGEKAMWDVQEGVVTVKPGAGVISTKQKFGDCQLHIEWRSPLSDDGEGQSKGNSGVFLMGRYEVQVLDSYESKTYANGQASSIYKQHIPLVNACRPTGEWQSYDIIFTAPIFGTSGRVVSPARVTVLHNGVLVQNNVSIWGPTAYIGSPLYKKHENKGSLVLQDHGDLVSFRNIWIREL